ncbi:MAG: hypothetical protein HY910_11720 [Desulfarculus sp.]|nr:hypothetical protein [Desulfarculus sp.]
MKWLRDRLKKAPPPAAAPLTMADFLAQAGGEIAREMAQDPDWFRHLPYQGGMSQDQARDFEIEKRAMWRRVIHDAGRGEIWGLMWTTRGDAKVCPTCREQEGRRFAKDQLDQLAAQPVHLGCRCELVPVRP